MTGYIGVYAKTCAGINGVIIGDVFTNGRLLSRSKGQTFRYTGTDSVVLIGRQRDGGENTDDRHDDHEFDKGKA